jgi:hypothetical protein
MPGAASLPPSRASSRWDGDCRFLTENPFQARGDALALDKDDLFCETTGRLNPNSGVKRAADPPGCGFPRPREKPWVSEKVPACFRPAPARGSGTRGALRTTRGRVGFLTSEFGLKSTGRSGPSEFFSSKAPRSPAANEILDLAGARKDDRGWPSGDGGKAGDDFPRCMIE